MHHSARLAALHSRSSRAAAVQGQCARLTAPVDRL
jgi:hypothetical protein